MAFQRTRRTSLCSGRSLRSLGSPLNARPLGDPQILGRPLLLALIAVIAACRQALPIPVGTAVDEDSVYESVFFVGGDRPSGPLINQTVVHATASPDELRTELARVHEQFTRFSQEIPRLRSETLRDFEAKAMQPRDLRRSIFASRMHPDSAAWGLDARVLVDARKIRGSARPHLAISRVAFDPDITQALLYVENRSGTERGSGGKYLFLIRTGGQWKVVRSINTWVS